VRWQCDLDLSISMRSRVNEGRTDRPWWRRRPPPRQDAARGTATSRQRRKGRPPGRPVRSNQL